MLYEVITDPLLLAGGLFFAAEDPLFSAGVVEVCEPEVVAPELVLSGSLDSALFSI